MAAHRLSKFVAWPSVLYNDEKCTCGAQGAAGRGLKAVSIRGWALASRGTRLWSLDACWASTCHRVSDPPPWLFARAIHS